MLKLEINIPDDAIPIVVGGTLVLVASQGPIACTFYDPSAAKTARDASIEVFGRDLLVSLDMSVKVQTHALQQSVGPIGFLLADTPGDPS